MASYIDGRAPQEVRGYVTAPTGSGKTVIFARLLEDMRRNDRLPRTLILVPTKQLVQQTQTALLKHGFSGNIDIVSGWNRDRGQADVRIATYNGFARWGDEQMHFAIEPSLYGLVIMDEAHHLQGEQTQKALRNKFSHAMQLGFTATPDYDEVRQLRNILPDEVHRITNDEAVLEGLVAPYVTTLLATNTDMSGVKVVGYGEYDMKDMERVLNTEVRNYGIARFYADNFKDQKGMFNTSTIAHAESMAEALRHFGVMAVAIHGGMPRDRQQEIVEAFRQGKILALTQAKLLGEGYDEPTIEVVVNVDPTLSRLKSAQRTGRGQRIDANNPSKTMVVVECVDYNYRKSPVLYGDANITGRWRSPNSFLDPRILEQLDRASRYDMQGLKLVTDTATIAEWYKNAAQGSNILALLGGAALTSSVTETTAHAPIDLPDSFDVVVPKVIDTSVRRNSKTKSKEGFEPIFEFDPNSVHDLATLRKWTYGTPKFYASDAYYESTEAHRNVPQNVNLGRGQESKPEQKPSTQQQLTEYVVDGTLETGAIKAAGPHDIKMALKSLAGSDVLKDPKALERYQRLNVMAAAPIDERAELLEDVQSRGGGTGFRHQDDDAVTVFSHPDAACASPEQDKERFFPERGASTEIARRQCLGCTVLKQCFDASMEGSAKFGIWGGTSVKQRKELRRVRAERGEKIMEAALELILEGYGKRYDVPVVYLQQLREE